VYFTCRCSGADVIVLVNIVQVLFFIFHEINIRKSLKVVKGVCKKITSLGLIFTWIWSSSSFIWIGSCENCRENSKFLLEFVGF
jgi:hypothetical protein